MEIRNPFIGEPGSILSEVGTGVWRIEVEDPGFGFAEAVLVYDGPDGVAASDSLTDMEPVDLTQDGNNAFQLTATISPIPEDPPLLQILIYSAADAISAYFIPLDDNPGERTLAFSDAFPTFGTPGANFASIRQIKLQLFVSSGPSGGSYVVTVDDLKAADGTSPSSPPDQFSDPTGSVYAGHPIDTFGGNLYEVERPDLNLGGGVFLQRSYDSAIFTDAVISSRLGNNWQHNYDISLSISGAGAGATAILGFRYARIIRFENDGANWNLVGRTRIAFRLYEVGAEFLLVDPRSQLQYFFDAAGRLVRLEDGRGNVHSLGYVDDPSSAAADLVLHTVSDGLGRTLTFDYDADDLLASVTDGTRTVFYDHTAGNLTLFTDANGKTTTYSYTSVAGNPGLMTAKILPEGNTIISQSYHTEGRVAVQTDGVGETMSLSYAQDATTRTTTITDQVGAVEVHTYNLTGALIQRTDAEGNTIDLGVDADDRRNSVTGRMGNVTGLTYDLGSSLPTQVDFPSNPDVLFTYGTRSANIGGVNVDFSDLAQRTVPDGAMDQFTYDSVGNLIQFQNRANDTWTYTYNGRGQLLTSMNPFGCLTGFTYDSVGRLATSTDDEVGISTYQYDTLNRLISVTRPDSSTLQISYDPLDRIISLTDERGQVTGPAYDDNSRLTEITDPASNTTTFEYDANDRLVRVVDRLGHDRTATYDPRGLIESITDENDNTTQYAFDSRERLTSTTNPGGQTTTFTYNEEGLLLSVSNPLSQTTTLTRDEMGYVTTIEDPLHNTAIIARDEMKRITMITDPLLREITYGYTPRGQVETSTDIMGGVGEPDMASQYTYDKLGKLTQVTDPNGHHWSSANSPMGRMSSFTDPLGRVTTYTYDNRGRRSTTTMADGVTMTTTYDAESHITQLEFSPGGPTLQYTYDGLDRLATATDVDAGDTLTFSYDAEGRLLNTSNDGVSFGAGYDPGGRLTNVTYPDPGGLGGPVTVSYAYDTRDRLIQVSDDLTGTTLAFTYDDADRLTGITRPSGVNTTYTYDAAGRLTRIQEGILIDVQYTLDAAGQVTEADYVNVPLDPAHYLVELNDNFTYDNASQLSSAGYAYDDRARLLLKSGLPLTWDGASRLRTIGPVALAYTALGDLLTRTDGGGVSRYFYNYALGMRPIVAERNDVSMQFERFYVWSAAGSLLYVINLPGATVSHPHFDRTGSTLALTDAAGAVSDAYAYDPYGRILGRTGSSSQPFQYAGRFGVRRESAGDLHHMRARYYDPNTARFLSRDPVWPVFGDPRALNFYQYALLNPVSGTDPEGTFTLIELIHPISIMAAISAQVIPHMIKTKRSTDTAAIGSLRTLVSGQAMFYQADPEEDLGERVAGGSLLAGATRLPGNSLLNAGTQPWPMAEAKQTDSPFLLGGGRSPEPTYVENPTGNRWFHVMQPGEGFYSPGIDPEAEQKLKFTDQINEQLQEDKERLTKEYYDKPGNRTLADFLEQLKRLDQRAQETIDRGYY